MGQHQLPAFNPARRFVRLREVRTDGFVEFEFAVGDLDMSMELILPVAAFHEFCAANQVVQISPVKTVAS